MRRKAPRPAWRTAVLWGLIGFACGIAFWHLIGFWGFISNVLLPPNPMGRAETGQLTKTHQAQPSSALPARAARPRLARGAQPADAVALPREGELAPAAAPPRLTSAAD